MTISTDYRITVRVNAPADIVFNAVTTTEGLTAWWSPVTGSGLTGGELLFPMVADQPPLLVRVDEATRPTTVRWTVTECTFMEDWVGTQPTFTITPIDNGSCEVNFEHCGLSDKLQCKDMCSRSWDHLSAPACASWSRAGRRSNRSPRDLARRAAEVNG